MDTFFFGLCINICAHFKILRSEIEFLELTEFVSYHRKVIDLSRRVNQLFKLVIFTAYLLMSILLCVTAFYVVTATNFLEKIPTIMHGLGGLIDLFIYSYGGQSIMDCAMEVCDDSFQSNKAYWFVLQKTQEELEIKSWIFHASLPTFCLIMNQTNALITLLQSFE